MRVVLCTDGVYPQAMGGMQRHSRLLAEHLARSGKVALRDGAAVEIIGAAKPAPVPEAGTGVATDAGADADLAAYQQYLSETAEETLTLLSCWPPDNNTHRVVIQAIPVNADAESLSLFGTVMLK